MRDGRVILHCPDSAELRADADQFMRHLTRPAEKDERSSLSGDAGIFDKDIVLVDRSLEPRVQDAVVARRAASGSSLMLAVAACGGTMRRLIGTAL
jgi:hypothetical protein